MDRYEALMNLAIKKESVSWYSNMNKLEKNTKTPTKIYENVTDDARSIHLFFFFLKKKLLIEYYI